MEERKKAGSWHDSVWKNETAVSGLWICTAEGPKGYLLVNNFD